MTGANSMQWISEATTETFEREVLERSATTLVLVDFWAEWCGPCKAIAPVLAEIAEEYTGKVTIAKLNIDDNQRTAPMFGVRGIPTLILFKNGVVEAQQVGMVSKTQLKAFLDSNL